MHVITAPEKEINDGEQFAIFLAGGITNCPEWQDDIIKMMNDVPLLKDVTLFNPRRKNFPIHDPNAANEQITWEYWHLHQSDAILFWFPKETLCPIVLFELGAHSMRDIPIAVGVHPEYKRKQDVVIQMSLKRPKLNVVTSLEDLVAEICAIYRADENDRLNRDRGVK